MPARSPAAEFWRAVGWMVLAYLAGVGLIVLLVSIAGSVTT